MLTKVLLPLTTLLVFAGTAVADISSCTLVGGGNSCNLYETDAGTLVPLAQDYETPDLLYIVLLEAGKFNPSITADWSDIVKFSEVGSKWYVQLFSDPLSNSLVGEVLDNRTKGGFTSESGPPTIFSTDGTNQFNVYSSEETPEPSSILLFGTVLAVVGRALRSGLNRAS